MECQKCKSSRVLSISGKCSDCCSFSLNGKKSSNYSYVPEDMGIGGGDYITLKVCLDCGQVQGTWPKPLTEFEQEPEDNEMEDLENREELRICYKNWR